MIEQDNQQPICCKNCNQVLTASFPIDVCDICGGPMCRQCYEKLTGCNECFQKKLESEQEQPVSSGTEA